MAQFTPALGSPDELMMEQKPPGMLWLLFAAGVPIFAGLTALVLPPTKVTHYIALIMFPLMALTCIVAALYLFKTRNDSVRFWGDRAEHYKSGARVATLPYADVEAVAFGFREKNDQFLTFHGPDRQVMCVLTVVTDPKAGPTATTEERVYALRELLYQIVANRMIQQSAQPQGADWFGGLAISRKGLLVQGQRVNWIDVDVTANNSNGQVAVRVAGKLVGRTSMIEDNVVPGLIVVERIQKHLAKAQAART